MNRRILVIVCCALVLSVCASYLVYRAVGVRAAPRQQRTVEIVIAARYLAAGTLIREADLKMASWPAPPPEGAVVKRDALRNRGCRLTDLSGRAGYGNRLAPAGSGGGLASTIPSGMRACAVKVNDVAGVAGFVVPGMRVDVLVTGLPPGGSALEGPRVRTLLQNIEVLSAGTNFQKDKEGKPEPAQVVNLLVTPAQAEILSLASYEMHIQLVLRNPMDTGISTPPGIIMSELFGGNRSPQALPPVSPRSPGSPGQRPVMLPAIPVIETSRQAAPLAVPPPYTIEVSNGSVHTEARFARAAENQ